MKNPKEIFVTKPLLPDLGLMQQQLSEIWQSGILTNYGEKHALLEKELAKFLKISNIILYNNATTALLIAIRALDLKGEVITTPFTFGATTHTLNWNNITPVFCDIDENNLCINPDKIEELITDKTSGILGVHVYGQTCAVKKIDTIAKNHHLKVIYDAAHAFTTEINNESITNYGDASILSFHATKLFNTAEGGAIVFQDERYRQKLNLLKNFGIKNEEEVVFAGINGKMNEIQAALGLLNLKLVESEQKKRSKVAEMYRLYLNNIEGIRLLKTEVGTSNSYQYFPIIIDEAKFGATRDDVHGNLKAQNIFSRKYFYPLISNYDCYKNLPSAAINKLPIANKISKQILCLPFYGDLKEEDINRICKIILESKKTK